MITIYKLKEFNWTDEEKKYLESLNIPRDVFDRTWFITSSSIKLYSHFMEVVNDICKLQQDKLEKLVNMKEAKEEALKKLNGMLEEDTMYLPVNFLERILDGGEKREAYEEGASSYITKALEEGIKIGIAQERENTFNTSRITNKRAN